MLNPLKRSLGYRNYQKLLIVGKYQQFPLVSGQIHSRSFSKYNSNNNNNKERVFGNEASIELQRTLLDHYTILGCRPNSSPEKIKEQYRKLAFQYHPDTIAT